MSVEEKAKELMEKFSNRVDFGAYPNWVKETAKQCALITIEEIENSYDTGNHYNPNIEFWQKVKEEINKL